MNDNDDVDKHGNNSKKFKDDIKTCRTITSDKNNNSIIIHFIIIPFERRLW